MTDVTDVMSLHPFGQAYYDRQKCAREHNKKNCNNDDDEKVQPQLTQMAKGYRCHICGSDKHKKPDCTKKNLPREQWFITKAMDKMLHQRDDESNDDEYSESDDDEHSTRSNSSRTRSASRNRSRGRSCARRQSNQEDWCSFQHDWSNMQCIERNPCSVLVDSL